MSGEAAGERRSLPRWPQEKPWVRRVGAGICLHRGDEVRNNGSRRWKTCTNRFHSLKTTARLRFIWFLQPFSLLGYTEFHTYVALGRRLYRLPPPLTCFVCFWKMSFRTRPWLNWNDLGLMLSLQISLRLRTNSRFWAKNRLMEWHKPLVL